MSADELREAARLMRERAEGATRGLWEEFAAKPAIGGIYNGIGTAADPNAEICRVPRTPQGSADSWHIASWHPAVALAVADLLDNMARGINSGNDLDWPNSRDIRDALRVARAYLGSD